MLKPASVHLQGLLLNQYKSSHTKVKEDASLRTGKEEKWGKYKNAQIFSDTFSVQKAENFGFFFENFQNNENVLLIYFLFSKGLSY